VRPIKDYPNFYISNTGEVFSTARGEGVIRRKYNLTKDGYKRMSLTHNGDTLRLHREVLKAFDRPPKVGELCRHLDGNPQNNHISNLKWGTPKENAQDCLKHKRNPFQRLVGEKSPASKFSDEVVAEIRACHEVGFTYREIIGAYGISKAHVSYIVNNKTRIKKEK
jgi:hypothetical protein